MSNFCILCRHVGESESLSHKFMKQHKLVACFLKLFASICLGVTKDDGILFQPEVETFAVCTHIRIISTG